MGNPNADPRWMAAYTEETVRQRLEQDRERSALEREAEGDGPTEDRRRSPLAIVAWIVVGAVFVLAVLVLSGKVHL